MEILSHRAHDVEAFLCFQCFCSSRDNDFSRSDRNLLPTPDIENPKLCWLRVVYLPSCFCEDTYLDLVCHLRQVHHSTFYLRPKLPPTGYECFLFH